MSGMSGNMHDPTIHVCLLWALTERDIEDHASFDNILAFAADNEAGFSELQTHAKAKRLGQFIHQLALSLLLHSKHCAEIWIF